MWAATIRRGIRRLNAAYLVRPSYIPLGRYAAVVTRDGHRLHLVAEDLSVTPTLALTGQWEPRVASLLRRLLRPGDRVVEGGANVGAHTIPMADRIGPRGRIDAFEPLPDFHPLLERSLGVNRVADRVVLHQAALLDRAGPVEILLDPVMLGSGHLAMEHVSARYSRRVAAQATTLDAALADDGGRPVDLIRLDVEGTEMLALRGAEGVIRRSPRLSIVMEWSPEMLRSRGDPAAEAAWLAGFGFRFWRVMGRHWSTPWRGHALVPVAVEALAGLPHGEVLARREPP
jgi:FkbM family methyltransferase